MGYRSPMLIIVEDAQMRFKEINIDFYWDRKIIVKL